MAVGCPFITCAIKKKGVEFCWDCEENKTCDRCKKHRESGKKHDSFKYDSFKCYQKLEGDIEFIQKNGVAKFEKIQNIWMQILKEILKESNEGRSKSYYYIASTVMDIEELKEALNKARQQSKELETKEKSKLLHSILDEIAGCKKYHLKLRK